MWAPASHAGSFSRSGMPTGSDLTRTVHLRLEMKGCGAYARIMWWGGPNYAAGLTKSFGKKSQIMWRTAVHFWTVLLQHFVCFYTHFTLSRQRSLLISNSLALKCSSRYWKATIQLSKRAFHCTATHVAVVSVIFDPFELETVFWQNMQQMMNYEASAANP